jgi:CRISPR/Cas system-associated endonuclease Cas3-HD
VKIREIARKIISRIAANSSSISTSKKTVKEISKLAISSLMIQKVFSFYQLKRIHHFKLKSKAFQLKIHSKRLNLYELVLQSLHA